MGFLDRLLGREPREQIPGMYQGGGAPRQQYGQAPGQTPEYGTAPVYGSAASTGRSEDEVAVERYRYLLRTAPPDRVEEAHAEAFAQLTPEQRTQVLAQLSETVPPGERATSDDPRDLARMATRAEMRNPGTLERNFGASRGPGFGSMLGASMLGTIGGMVIGSAVADMMFGSSFGDPAQDFAGGEEGAGAEGGGEEAGAEAGAEPVEASGADAGGDAGADAGGGFFGDFGGGDFGGGDFGGGDF
ncbi:hypothetical protein AB1046_15980 [Promicromonospora sp. Populi]|uniref:hypothetical protein n=1 Tax=Promicromonospora sp. Populi TaxID=3239420 RepID=UPI0034E1E857